MFGGWCGWGSGRTAGCSRFPRVGFIEHRNISKRMKVLPGHALRVSHPVFFTAGIATAGRPFVEQRHVGGPGSILEVRQFMRFVHLEPQVVQARIAAACGDREVHPRVFEHPLGVVLLHARGLDRRASGRPGVCGSPASVRPRRAALSVRGRRARCVDAARAREPLAGAVRERRAQLKGARRQRAARAGSSSASASSAARL